MKKFIQSYLRFSRKDRLGALALVLLGLTVYLLPKYFGKSPSPPAISADSTLVKAINQGGTDKGNLLKSTKPNGNIDYGQSKLSSGFKEGALFTFDPNSLSAEGWQKLGLNERTVNTILHYREKGGVFRRAEDLKKIWGLPLTFYERVSSYIEIKSEQQFTHPPTLSYSKAEIFKKNAKVIDINTADTSAFIALPGIGSRLAARIVNFREKLGGFYSVEQIGQTYGLPDSVFQKLKPRFAVQAEAVKKININTANKDDLKAHPYIKWNLANAIIEYRNQHGNFKNLEELRNISLVNAEVYEKLAPYLVL